MISIQCFHLSNPRLLACNPVHFQLTPICHHSVKNQGLHMPFLSPHEEFCKLEVTGTHKLLCLVCLLFRQHRKTFWKDEPVEELLYVRSVSSETLRDKIVGRSNAFEYEMYVLDMSDN